MSRLICVVSPGLTDELKEKIRNKASQEGYTAEIFDTVEEAIPCARKAEIVVGYGNELAQASESAKWFCSTSAGVDNYLQKGILREETILSNSSGAYGVTLAEHAMMLLLMVLRRQTEYNQIVENREWKHDLPIRSIYGSRVTVLGTGDLGRNVARRIRTFDPAVLNGVNRSGTAQGTLFDKIYTSDQAERFLPETDILVMCLPGTSETRYFMNSERIALLPKDAVVVNVGRGNAIDQYALVEALDEGRLWGAALDVFEKEPLASDDPLWNCDKLIITPHCAGNNTLYHTVEKIIDQFCEDLDNYCSGRPLKRQIDRSRGY